MNMEAEKAKPGTKDEKKHIDFKEAEGEESKKAGSSPKGRSSKLGPKYDREIKKFRAETLEKIEIFRAARGKWFESVEAETIGQIIDSKARYSLELDKRRVAIIKKLGFKINMIRAHRNTLRPRRFFTLKASISMLDFQDSQPPGAKEEKKIDPHLLKAFMKRAKKKGRIISKKEEKKRRETEEDDANVKEDTSVSSRTRKRGRKLKGDKKKAKDVSGEGYPVKVDPDKGPEEKTSTEPGPSVDDKDVKSTQKSADDKEFGDEHRAKVDEGKEAGIISDSEKQTFKEDKGEMDSRGTGDQSVTAEAGETERPSILTEEDIERDVEDILEDLRKSSKYKDIRLRDEDLEELKKVYDDYRKHLAEEKWKKLRKKAESVSGRQKRLELLHKLSDKTNMWLAKRRKRTWPPDAKPCNCQILEKDGIIIVKNLCECGVQYVKKNVTIQEVPEIIGEPAAGNRDTNAANAIELPLIRAHSSNIAGKIVDSLEIIRKKVSSKTSWASKLSITEEPEETDAAPKTGPPGERNAFQMAVEGGTSNPEGNTAESIKDIYLPSRKFDSTTSTKLVEVDGKSAKIVRLEDGTTSVKDEEENESIIDIKKLKTPKKRTKAPQKDEVVLGKTQKSNTAPEDDSISREGIGKKEVKEVKPRKTWSTLSGKNKSNSEHKSAKVKDDSQDEEDDSRPPKPILGKGKRKKAKVEQGHVSFDVSDGMSTSSNISKYGQSTKNKMKTVMSVVNIIKKHN